MTEIFFTYYFHYFFYICLLYLLILLHKIKLYSEIVLSIKDNKLYFFFLATIFTILILLNSAFTPLVYFDEYKHILSAQNIIENGANAICTINANGQCQNFVIQQQSLGLSSTYALFYNHSFSEFYKIITSFNLLLYLFNAVLIFVISKKLYSYQPLSKAISLFMLLMPFTKIFATTAMPATISNTFLLISIYCFIQLNELRQKQQEQTEDICNNNYWLALFYSLTTLSTFRIEYCILLQSFLFMLLCSDEFIFSKSTIKSTKTNNNFKTKSIRALQTFSIIIFTAIMYCYASSYISKASQTISKINFGIIYFNGSYFEFFYRNFGFLIFTTLFLRYFTRTIIKLVSNKYFPSDVLKMILASIFFVFLLVYSFYRFPKTYRLLIPITSIYLLFSFAELYRTMETLKYSKQRTWNITFICFSLLGIVFTYNSIKWKKEILMNQKSNFNFSQIIHSNSLETLSDNSKKEIFYYFRASYLGQISRLNNYLDDYSLAVKKLKTGAKLFYIESPFEKFINSPFNNPKEFSVEEVDRINTYGIFKVKSLSEPKWSNPY